MAQLFRGPWAGERSAAAPSVRSTRARSSHARLALLVLGCLVVSSCTSSGPDEEAPRADGSIRAFSVDSPWNVPIPDDPVVDEDSADMVGALTADGGTAYALLYEYGVPVYEADSDTPLASVTCTQDWGDCPLEDQGVPIPDSAEPSSGTDAAMVVVDRSAGRVYDFWRAERTEAGSWTTSWGTWTPIDSVGTGGEAGGEGGGATGAGINLLAGLIRVAELQAGQIDHALALVSDTSCPEVYRYPATKTDGHAEDTPCVPQGARIQLDPSIDVAAIPGITPGELAVARALQIHGGYLRDSSEVSLGVVFEVPAEDDDPYPAAGLEWDYFDMPHIPWESLRVLDRWDGA